MEINDETIILVQKNDQGKNFPKWYDLLGDFIAGDPLDVVGELLKDLQKYGFAEYCPYRADITYEITVITEKNAHVDSQYGNDDKDESYWVRCYTPAAIIETLRAMGVPSGRVF